METATGERFARLARSSPWRWSTVRFTVEGSGPSALWPEPLRAWVRRPDGIRVETAAGRLVKASRQDPPARTYFTAGGGGRRRRGLPPMLTAADPDAPQPERDAAGLVVRRPAAGGRIDFDDPMFGDYYWVAMLDPVELADGDRFWPERAEPPPVAIDDARDVVHHGRSAVEAVLRPTASYQPRCPCCALLLSPAVVEASMARLDVRRGMVLPETFRVRLDGATGICVLVEELDGSRPGSGHDMAIEAVDEPMGDEMFRTRRAERRARARRPPLPRGR